MEKRPFSTTEFDWHNEQTSQQRDLSRFGGELDRLLSLRSRTPSVKAATARFREQWDRLKRRLQGRAARFGDQWDRQQEAVERLHLERERLKALVELDERLADGDDLNRILTETLNCVRRSISCEGALVVLYDIAGRTHRLGTDRGRGRNWPPSADLELAEVVATGARLERSIVIEGRPVGTGPRSRGRTSHWMAVAVAYEDELYGALVVGRTIDATGFGDDDESALSAICHRLGRVLVRKIGVSARPALGAGPRPEGFEQLWGQSQAFKQALALAANYALSDAPILIEGETGTGRETLARAVHRRSARSDGPFVVVKTADLPEDVVAQSFFGVTAITADGDLRQQAGDLELADGGTLYIDEVAALGPVFQVRLLRFLQDGTFEREGDRTQRHTNVRLILATTENPDRALAEGRLRQDLYYLITVARVWLPPLRERGASDIIDLARRLAQVAGRKCGKTIDGIDLAAARRLASGTYPGNVRQLAQIIGRAVLLANGPLITEADLPLPIPQVAEQAVTVEPTTACADAVTQAVRLAATAGTGGAYHQLKQAKKDAVHAVERAFVETVLATVGRNWSRAARHCGIHRAQWQRLLRTTGIVRTPVARDKTHDPSPSPNSDTTMLHG